MTKYAPLWQQAGSYPSQLDRYLLGALWPAGGMLGGAATAVTNTLQVSIAPGSVAVPLQPGQGTALCHWDAAELVTLGAGPGAGTTRVDLIVAQVRDNAIDGGPNNDWLFTVVTGTPAALLAETREEEGDEAEVEQQAVAPAVPANSLAVAQVTVPATAVNLNGATITDRRPGGLTTAVPAVGVKAGVYRNAAYSLSTALAPLPFDTVVYDSGGNFNTGTRLFTCPVPGFYLVEGGIIISTTIAGNQLMVCALLNGAEGRRWHNSTWQAGVVIAGSGSSVIQCKAGDKLGVGHQVNGGTGFTGAGACWGSFTLLTQ